MSTHGAGGAGSGGRRRGGVSAAGLGRTLTYRNEGERIAEILERPVTPEQIANLAGAPAGSQVEVSANVITVSAPDGSMQVVHVLPPTDSETGVGLLNWLYQNPAGDTTLPFPVDALVMQVRQAHTLGVEYIHAKVHSRTGAFTLPRMGFDAPLDAHLITETGNVPPPVPGRLLSDVLATAQGQTWWLDNANTPGLNLDLTPGSYGMRALDIYLAVQGLPPV